MTRIAEGDGDAHPRGCASACPDPSHDINNKNNKNNRGLNNKNELEAEVELHTDRNWDKVNIKGGK